MNPEYWRSRWATNEIGFHCPKINPWLERFADRLPLAESKRLLVPLCGKSLDLVWLRNRGHEVTGVELAEQAVADFHREQGIEPTRRNEGGFAVCASPGLEIWQGDFFAFRAAASARPFDAVFDRAALIALPAHLRVRYADELKRLVRPGGRILLVTVHYDQAKMDGPPFSVDDAEVRRLYKSHAVEKLGEEETIGKNPRFAEKGLRSMVELAYSIVLG